MHKWKFEPKIFNFLGHRLPYLATSINWFILLYQDFLHALIDDFRLLYTSYNIFHDYIKNAKETENLVNGS